MIIEDRKRDLRYISDPVFIFNHVPNIVWQSAGHFDRVDAFHIPVQPLPSCDPCRRWISEGDDALKQLRCAAVYLFFRTLQVEELFAVWASFVEKPLLANS